jgi:hypothetical protein
MIFCKQFSVDPIPVSSTIVGEGIDTWSTTFAQRKKNRCNTQKKHSLHDEADKESG